ncbi:MAG: SseB family protein [Bacteroidota bacterium]
MGFFKSFFNKPQTGEPYKGLPENKQLLGYIAEWYKQPSDETYKKTVMELMNGKPTLLLPSVNNEINIGPDGWQTSDANTSLKLTCIYEIEGLKALGAFTDEEALLTWSQNRTEYVALKSNDVLKLCEQNGISRLVINSNCYNMFVMQRSREEVKTYTIPEGTTVRVGTPERPLPKRIVEKMQSGFKTNINIKEAYEYLNSYADEYGLVIGIVLVADSEEGRSAATFLVQDALRGEGLEQPVDIFFLQDASWLQTIKQIPGSKFYG